MYILHRGRPRLVLTSVETMDALCAAHPSHEAGDATVVDPVPVLDAIDDLVLVADAAGAILASSRTARAYFGGLARLGAAVDAITPLGGRARLTGAILRVIDWGVGERIEIACAARPPRTLLLAIEPAGRGVAVIAHDAASDQGVRAARATAAAHVAALDTAGGATVTLDTSGLILTPSTTLAALVGLDPPTLPQRRFTALLPESHRTAIEDLLALAVRDRQAGAIDSALLSARSRPLPVRIGIAPIRCDGAIGGVVVVILVTGQISDLV